MTKISNPDALNSLEVLQVQDWMQQNNPNIDYTLQPGNDCIWVSWGSSTPVNLYFIFQNGQITDIQVD